jgi:diguanylate cyclase
MTSKDKKQSASTSKALLGRALKKNEKIKESVKSAASELSLVNDVLKHEKAAVQTIKRALTQNESVELKVAKAADDLKQVNVQLTEEIADRIAIESELADVKSSLDEARDDLSKVKTQAAEAQQVALHDALTGLANRVLFKQGLDQALLQAERHGWRLAVLFIDLDDFKRINDSYGHDLGDQVLLVVASRLKSFLRDQDIVGRWGGDEFVCLLFEVKQEVVAMQLAEKMIKLMAEACEVNGHALSIAASIGVAMYPAEGDTSDALLKAADTAMYKVKGAKRPVLLLRDSSERQTA